MQELVGGRVIVVSNDYNNGRGDDNFDQVLTIVILSEYE